MTIAVCVIGGMLLVLALAISGHLGRIADAIEKQNKHYKIGTHAGVSADEPDKEA